MCEISCKNILPPIQSCFSEKWGAPPLGSLHFKIVRHLTLNHDYERKGKSHFFVSTPGTLPKTNMEPENQWLKDEFPLGMACFQRWMSCY